MGTNSGVAGVFSAIIAINIENVSKTVKLSRIFSDARAGNKNTANERADNKRHGIKTWTIWYAARRRM